MFPLNSQRAKRPYWPNATKGLEIERPTAMIIKQSRNKFLVFKMDLEIPKT